MIKSIHMKNCATYDQTGSEISECHEINFIYGSNGSGKSTISNFLQSQKDELYADSKISWGNNSHQKVVVYNRRFRDENFKMSSEQDIKGIFTLGEDNIKNIVKIKDLKDEKNDLDNKLIQNSNSLKSKKQEIHTQDLQFQESIWTTIYLKNKTLFHKGVPSFKKSKNDFKNKVIEKFNPTHSLASSVTDLNQRAEVLHSDNIEEYSLINFKTTSLLSTLISIEENSFWEKLIIGNKDIPIGKLIQTLNNNDWVNTGRQYIHDTDECPFCQKRTIDSEFKKQLGDFFNKEYESNLSHLDTMLNDYTLNRSDLSTLLKSETFISPTLPNNIINKEEFEATIKLIENNLQQNISYIESKKQEPSKKIRLSSSRELFDKLMSLIENTNEKINKHNNIVKNSDKEKEKLENDIWGYLLNEQKKTISDHISSVSNINKAINSLEKAIESLESDIRIKSNEISEAGKEITSIQPSVDEINNSLKSYGFQNFSICVSEQNKNYYQLKRSDGTSVKDTLSEGETTFITFLYFMQLIKGDSNESDVSLKKILVIDDPVSSLDSTILYIVSTMIKKLCRDIRGKIGDVEQVFIFTHNVSFHRETSFTGNREDKNNDTNYWIIRKNSEISSIQSYNTTNPISTYYELLWNEIREPSDKITITSLGNTMRRIIENYFHILGNERDNKIEESFTTIEDKIVYKSLLSWVNVESHTMPEDLFIESGSDQTEKFKEIFKKIFINMGHENHYNMMMKITTENE